MEKHPVAQYWEDVKAGKREMSPNQGKRGADKKPRKGTSMKSFEKRYYEKTGRTIFQDMGEQQDEIQMMKELAMSCNDPEKKFDMLATVNSMREKYNRQWAPYLQAKQGTLQTDVRAEEQESLEDLLDGSNETY